MESEEKKSKAPRNGLIYLFIALNTMVGIYAFKKTSDYNKLENVFRLEQAELKEDLDELIEDYKDLSIKKKSISKRLVKEMDKIVALRDSVSTLKSANYDLIRKYRKRITTLERENRYLFVQVDSLSNENQNLKTEKKLVAEKLSIKNAQTNSLKQKNNQLKASKNELENKVAIAGIIKTSDITVTAMKERNSGKLTTTSRSSRTDAFKVSFNLLENKVTKPGRKKIHIQIVDQDNRVVAVKGTANLVDGSLFSYSDELVADYANQTLSIVSLILVNRDDINKGIYKINTYVQGRLTGTTSLKLR